MSIATMPELKTRSFKGRHHRQLMDLRDSARRRRIGAAFVAVLVLLVVGVATVATLDFFLELETSTRLFGLLTALAGVSLMVWLFRRKLRFEAADAATAAEHAWPDLGQRIRTSHDYAILPDVAKADPHLIAALERETDKKTVGREFDTLAPAWPIWTALGVFGALICAWFLMLLIVPESRISTARAMLIPANYTDVEVAMIPERVAQGDDVEIRADVSGRPLQSAAVLFRPAGSGDDGEWSRLDMAPANPGPLRGTLLAVIPDCRDAFEVRVEAGAGPHPVQHVFVQAPLVLEEWTAAVAPPAYTGLPATDGPAERLRVPQGSHLTMTARYNRAPETVDPEFLFENAAPAWRQDLDDLLLTGSLDNLQESLQLTLRARAADGMTDESYPLRIRVIPDEAPLVRFTSPDEQAEAIPTEEVRFSIDASDDYGISRVGILYKIGNGLEQTLWEAAPEDLPGQFRHTAVLPLEELQLTFNEAITYYAFVEDNRAPEPQLTLSELGFLDIRPFSREYQFREGQCSGCQGECLTLEKLISEQRSILQRTFSAIQRDATGQGPELAEQEQALQEKTASLAQALAAGEVGTIAPLENAVDAMEIATAALEADNVPMGYGLEETALADLIEARQNLRRILKQGNSQSQAARNADQREMQKLRPPEREPQEQEQEQLARLRREMEQLAQQQRSFCQSASQCSSSSQSPSQSQSQSPSQSQSQSQSRSQSQSQSQSSSQGSPQPSQQSPESQDGQQSPSREELVNQQREAAEAAERLQQELADGRFGDLAPERMQQASESISQSGEDLAGERDEESIAEAERAADELERLSRHLGRRHAPDFGERLGHAQRQAEQLGSEQRALAQGVSENNQKSESNGAGQESEEDQNQANGGGNRSPQQRQQSLADRGEELADLIEQLQQDASEQDWTVQRRLTEEIAAHPPQDAAAAMQSAAGELAAGENEQASRSGHAAADDLEGLAAGLRNVQTGLGEARLEQLLAAEEQAAELLQDMERADSPSEQSLANARAEEFAESLQGLARGDQQLSESLQNLRGSAARTNSNPLGSASPREGVSSDERPDEERPEGRFGESARNSFEGLRVVDQMLQRRIQEAILSGSLQQADEAVPPEYTKMVEDYYRTLSEDIE